MKRNDQVNEVKADARQVDCERIDQYTPSAIATGVLWLVIPYTTPELTRAALRHSGVCSDLDVHVRLVDIQVVPFPCPLDEPPINKEFSEHRLRELLKESQLPGQATVLYTRDWLEAFKKVLEPGSLII